MSTEWDVYCVNCERCAGFEDNHGRDRMRAYIEKRATLEAAAALGRDLKSLGLMGLEVAHCGGGSFPVWFFAEHAGHKLVPRDEYGSLDGECAKRVRCATCSALHWCKRPKDHEGDCGVSP